MSERSVKLDADVQYCSWPLTDCQCAVAMMWIPVETHLPNTEEDVLIFHCLGDSRAGDHAYDVAAYINGKWIFPWDRGSLNNPPRWVVAWMPIPGCNP